MLSCFHTLLKWIFLWREVFLHSEETNCVCVCVFLQYESSGLGLISSRLRTTLNRIQENLIDMVKLSLLFPLFFSLLPSPVTSSPVSVFWHKHALSTQIPTVPLSSLCLCPYFFTIPLYPTWPYVWFPSSHRHIMHYGSSLSGQWSLTHTHTSLLLSGEARVAMCVFPLGL